jgi:type IV secretion system protein VirB9
MHRAAVLLVSALLCSACASTHLPPADPEEPTVFEAPVPAEPAPAPLLAEVPVTAEPVLVPPPEELQAVQAPAGPPEPPARVIEHANQQSRVRPSRQGYAQGHSAMQRYPYRPGALYEIYSSPQHPTTIILPPGERLAAAPTLNPDVWVVAVVEMGTDEQRQEAVIVRPVAPQLEATTPLLTQSGKTFFCRLRSFVNTLMVAVTWEMPLHLTRIPGRATASETVPIGPPTVDVSRLHTAYTMQSQGGPPPWMPLSVYDDGRRTFIRFKELLSFTAAPAVFARHADGTPGPVDFAPYQAPDAPEKGMYYIVHGLWPRLDLRGEDGQRVRITRLTTTISPWKAARELEHP